MRPISFLLPTILLSACYTSEESPRQLGDGGRGKLENAGRIDLPQMKDSVVTFSQNPSSGEATAHLPVTRKACRERQDGPGFVHYQLMRLFRIEVGSEGSQMGAEWKSVRINSRPTVLSCNQASPLVGLAGLEKLDDGTYWAISEVDDQPDLSFVYIGRMACQDVRLAGPLPPDRIAICVINKKHAAPRLVPKPPLWEMVGIDKSSMAPRPMTKVE